MKINEEVVTRDIAFLLSEKMLGDMLQTQLRDVVYQRYRGTHSTFLLRGTLGEIYSPTAAIGIFPTPTLTSQGYVFQPEVVEINPRKTVEEYW